MDENNATKMPERYEPQEIEPRWQAEWESRRTFHAPDDDPRDKLYVLQMFPYPSGDLHAGHIRNYVIGDAIARYWRMRGYNVMHPMGFDSFGLPAEQAAIDRSIQPAEWIDRCVKNSRRQFKQYGFSFDWQREVVTSDPDYYRWTQWLFIKFYEMGLIYRKQVEVNWCPEHGVLANDEVKEGCCWRCDSPVAKKKMEQWNMRTTKYAQQLLDNLEQMPGWTNAVRTMQHNWIGRSEGTNITFSVPALAGKLADGQEPELTVFTTRVDTIYGCTFMAIAPDHPLAEAIAREGDVAAELARFRQECAREDVKYTVAEEKPKRGIYLGVDCINPFNGEPVQVWATNYVLSDFGTGAVMAVPAHDSRDNAFAREYGLPIRQVIAPLDGVIAEDDPGTSSNHGDAKTGGAGVPARESALAATRRRLPHWELPGSVYFFTWRLLPEQRILTPAGRTIVAKALEHFDNEKYQLFAYVVMDDHVHVLARPLDGHSVSEVLHSWKSYTANRLQREEQYIGAVWEEECFDRVMRSEDEFWQTLEYILNNPRKRWPEDGEYQWVYWTQPDEVLGGAQNGGHGGPPPRLEGTVSSSDNAPAGAETVYPPITEAAYTEKGVCINSGPYDGMDFPTAKAAMDEWLAAEGKGGGHVQYKLRDWNMGRQRFWGAPIPMVRCAECGWQPVPAEELPVKLPDSADYSDIRVSPLANDTEWRQATCPTCGKAAERDTDTMTTFMCSAWYFLRFCDPHNSERAFDPALVRQWLPVDYYIGGKEHAVGHLLYSRVITMALAEAGLITLTKGDHLGGLPKLGDEPFLRLFNQGIVYKDGAKMSKSKGNVVSADELAESYGADTARVFSFFGGPADHDLEWSTAGVEGCSRFLRRIWRLTHSVLASGAGNESIGEHCEAVVKARHKAVAGVTSDLTGWQFNTAIAKLMEYLNELESRWQAAGREDCGGAFRNALITLAQLLSPFAPHFAEELWLHLGGLGLCCDSDWPVYDPGLLVEESIELPVQVNGKVRGKITVAADAAEDDVFSTAEADENVARHLEGKQLVKRIYIPGRMVTLVVKG